MEAKSANWQRLAADGLTALRALGTIGIVGNVMRNREKFRSWGLAASFGAVALTDLADGYLARRSKQLRPASAAFDELTDKALYHGTINAIGRANKNPQYQLYSFVTGIRDMWVSAKRRELRAEGLSAQSRQLGKAKAWAQMLAIAADLSPLGETSPKLVKSMHLGAVALSLASGAEFVLEATRAQSGQQYVKTLKTDSAYL